MATRKSNIEFVTEIMEFGNPLKQAFIIEAIAKYAEQCKDMDADNVDFGFISAHAWRDCAVEISTAIEEHYKNAA